MAGTTRNAPMDRDLQTAIQAMITKALNDRVVCRVNGKQVRGTLELNDSDTVSFTVDANGKVKASAK